MPRLQYTRARRIRGGLLGALLAAILAPAHAGSFALAVGATVLSKNVCKFSTAAGSVLAFGAINPSGAANATATIPLTFSCSGSNATASWSISSNDGQFATGPGAPRMRHATVLTAFLPYTLNAPLSGTTPKNTATTVNITGTITPAQYGNAIAGSYSDTVVLTLAP